MQRSFSLASSPPPVTGKYGGDHTIGGFRRIPIASNNSCLFSSINYLLHRGSVEIRVLRELVSCIIEGDPDTFNDITLDQPRATYLQWIRRDDSWGGYIELIAFSKAYGIQVIVIDVLSGRKDEYGDVSMGRRIFLMYDGLHYDALAAEDVCCCLSYATPNTEHTTPGGLAEGTPPPETLVTIFDTNDVQSLEKAAAVVAEIWNARKFSSATQHPIECCICNKQLPNHEAVKLHALQTGHSRMSERRVV